jgi:uncharacterized protein YjiS (DUF1127 family)
MTTLDIFRPASTNRPGFAFAFANLLGAVTAWNERRATEDALSRLTDRELADVGLTRGDIPRIAAGGRR